MRSEDDVRAGRRRDLRRGVQAAIDHLVRPRRARRADRAVPAGRRRRRRGRQAFEPVGAERARSDSHLRRAGYPEAAKLSGCDGKAAPTLNGVASERLVACLYPAGLVPWGLMSGGLSDTEFAVLGLLTFGERSGYELDKLTQRSIGYFWRPAKSKIYAILPRLVERGLAESKIVAQEKRPDKQLYRITRGGERALRAWLDSPKPVARVARDGLLLKLFFGSHAGLDSLSEHVAERKRLATVKLAELEEIERTIDRDADFFPYLTLLHGLENTRATITWADHVLKLLERKQAHARA